MSVRRVSYQDPETGIPYTYLTNLPLNISPGIVALIYRSRWDVEKVFDEFKTKLGETKSWASTPTAKTSQARLLCLAHNLMTLMEEQILRETGVHNEAETHRKAQNLTKRDEIAKSIGWRRTDKLAERHPTPHSTHRKIHPLVEKPFRHQVRLDPSPGPPCQDLRHLMKRKLDTVA